MGQIWIGLILTTINFNLTAGDCVIGLLPDFVGYWFICKGLMELEEKSEWFKRMKPFATLMIGVSAVVYVLNVFGFYANMGLIATVIDVVTIAIVIYVTYGIVMGVQEMEQKYKVSLVGDIMKQAWAFKSVLLVGSYIAVFIPMLAIILVIGSFIAGIWFLIVFLQSKRLYTKAFGENN